MNRKAKYLGETIVENLEGTPYEGFTPRDWAMEYIERYGGIEGDHHRAWVLDQVARVLHGTPTIVTLARWDDGTEEYRIIDGEPSEAYLKWAASRREGDYSYDEGIAP